jgi:hypothetical protein
MNLHLTPERFALLDQGWLVVDGDAWYTHDDLSSLVGKKCERCHGQRRIRVPYSPITVEVFNVSLIDCPDCLGTGSELLTVETECETYGETHIGGNYVPGKRATGTGRCPHDPLCDHGTRSKLVHLTRQPVPIVEAWVGFQPPAIAVTKSGHCWRVTAPEASRSPIDLGPDPASLIGCFAFPCEVVQ